MVIEFGKGQPTADSRSSGRGSLKGVLRTAVGISGEIRSRGTRCQDTRTVTFSDEPRRRAVGSTGFASRC
jgi:hypothetical protein